MLLTGIFAEIEGSNIVSQARDGMAEVARQGYWQDNSVMTANHAFRSNKDGTRKDYRYYVCNRWANTKLCKPNSVKADILEEQVKQEMMYLTINISKNMSVYVL